ncbi:hypothetical protein ACFL3T_04090 [Patescibacteria group bacterium]
MSDQLVWYVVPIVIAASVFLIAVILEFIARKNLSVKKLLNLLRRGAFLSSTFLSILVGLILIIAGIQNYLFAPGLVLVDDSYLSLVLRLGQLAIGLSLILGSFIRLSTLGLIACFIAGFFMFPALDMLDYSIFLGIGLFLFLVHRDALSFSFFFHPVEKKEFFDQYRKHALPILRFLAGFTLAYAAWHHNIFDNSTAIAFLEGRPLLNFMQSLFGIESYSNFWFVIHTGIFSILLGALLAFGLLERIVSTIVAIGLIFTIFIGGLNFAPVVLPYFAIFYIIYTGNQFEERERIAKG